MRIGIALDGLLGLSYAEQRTVVRQALSRGYDNAWTNSLATGRDAFHTCAQWAATVADDSDTFGTGILVVPAPVWSALSLAGQAATVGDLSGGRFVLGVGLGGAVQAGFRRTFGIPDVPPIALAREYLLALRSLLGGEKVTLEGRAVTLRGVELGFRPPRVPIYLGALGPQMLRLAGELADGVAPNWCTPEQIAWCREQVADGARRAGRDPAAVQVVQYIRVCVDDDVEAARRALAAQVLAYAMAAPGAPKDHGYRGHFGRMGFDGVLTELEARRDAGAARDELIDGLPAELLLRVGYFGRAEGAAAAFKRMAVGLDEAIVRVVTTRPSLDRTLTTLEACSPARLAAA